MHEPGLVLYTVTDLSVYKAIAVTAYIATSSMIEFIPIMLKAFLIDNMSCLILNSNSNKKEGEGGEEPEVWAYQ